MIFILVESGIYSLLKYDLKAILRQFELNLNIYCAWASPKLSLFGVSGGIHPVHPGWMPPDRPRNKFFWGWLWFIYL